MIDNRAIRAFDLNDSTFSAIVNNPTPNHMLMNQRAKVKAAIEGFDIGVITKLEWPIFEISSTISLSPAMVYRINIDDQELDCRVKVIEAGKYEIDFTIDGLPLTPGSNMKLSSPPIEYLTYEDTGTESYKILGGFINIEIGGGGTWVKDADTGAYIIQSMGGMYGMADYELYISDIFFLSCVSGSSYHFCYMTTNNQVMRGIKSSSSGNPIFSSIDNTRTQFTFTNGSDANVYVADYIVSGDMVSNVMNVYGKPPYNNINVIDDVEYVMPRQRMGVLRLPGVKV